jgi:hypothetical protein
VLYPDPSGPVPKEVPQMKSAHTRYYSASRVWWTSLSRISISRRTDTMRKRLGRFIEKVEA